MLFVTVTKMYREGYFCPDTVHSAAKKVKAYVFVITASKIDLFSKFCQRYTCNQICSKFEIKWSLKIPSHHEGMKYTQLQTTGVTRYLPYSIADYISRPVQDVMRSSKVSIFQVYNW